MKIVTDCAADIPNEELERLGIVQAPLFIQFPEGEVDATKISADDFYNRLEAMRPQLIPPSPLAALAFLPAVHFTFQVSAFQLFPGHPLHTRHVRASAASISLHLNATERPIL